MRIRRRSLLMLAAVAGAVSTLLPPTAAFADDNYWGIETDYAVAISSPSSMYNKTCSSGGQPGVYVCFQPYGDIIYVLDTESDGNSAVAEWSDLDHSRDGSCVNTLGAGKWGKCNKNLPEGDRIRFWPAIYDAGWYQANGNYFDELA